MLKFEIIGNLGGDVEVKNDNGRQYAQFSVADTRRFKDAQGREVETTNWVSCFMRNIDSPVLQYLVKGTRVFVRGNGDLRLFSSAKDRMMKAGASINVTEIELVGSASTDIVPRELAMANGAIVQVQKQYRVPLAPFGDTPRMLYDRRGLSYDVDDAGYVTPAPTQADKPQDNQTTNADGSPVTVY